MNLAAEKIERRGEQTHDACEDEGSTHSFASRKPRKEQKHGHGEAATTDSSKSNGESNEESDQ